MFRTAVLRAKPGRVDRDGRTIHNAAVVQYGEARSHRTWLDEAFLDQVVAAGQAAGARGIKARWGHPGLSSDALGTYLGRWSNFHRDGMTVRADLSLAEVASSAPDGDLAGYIMDLAEEDSDAFGVSIVFRRDEGAMELFRAQHADAKGAFRSPDPNNKENYEHARLASLRAADAVDEPAATDGFFGDGGELPALAEAHLGYVLGLTEEPPAGQVLGVNPDRARSFVAGYLQRRGARIIGDTPSLDVEDLYQDEELNAGSEPGDIPDDQKGERTMADEAKTTPAAPAVDPKAIRDEALNAERQRVKDLNAAFEKDPALANQAIEKGWSVIEAKAAYTDKLQAENEQLKAAAAKPAKPAGAEPREFGGEGGGDSSEGSALERYNARVRELTKDGCSRQDATRHIERNENGLHRAMLAEVNR